MIAMDRLVLPRVLVEVRVVERHNLFFYRHGPGAGEGEGEVEGGRHKQRLSRSV